MTSCTFFAPSPHQPPSHHITLPPSLTVEIWKETRNGSAVCRRSSPTVPPPTAHRQSDPPPEKQPTNRIWSTGAQVSLRKLAILDDTPTQCSPPAPTQRGFEHSPADEMKLLQGQPSPSCSRRFLRRTFRIQSIPIRPSIRPCACALALAPPSLNQPLLLHC